MVQALQELPLQQNSSTMLTDIRVLHLQCKRAKVDSVGPCSFLLICSCIILCRAWHEQVP